MPVNSTAGPGPASKHATWTDWVDSGDWTKLSDGGVPALPALASEVMMLALDPDVSSARLAQAASKDQVLATRMLRLANSAYSAPMEEITTISDAIIRIGTTAVRNVVLATCMASRLRQGGAYGPLGRTLLDHGIGTAFLGQLVAEQAGTDSEEAFLYCLVHDLGKLLLLKLSKDYSRVGGKTPTAEEVDLVMRERHAEYGGRILRQWQLPQAIEDPVVFHHDPDACTRFPDEAAVAYVANRLSHRYGFGCDVTRDEEFLKDQVVKRMSITESWLEALDQRAPELFEGARQIVA